MRGEHSLKRKPKRSAIVFCTCAIRRLARFSDSAVLLGRRTCERNVFVCVCVFDGAVGARESRITKQTKIC